MFLLFPCLLYSVIRYALQEKNACINIYFMQHFQGVSGGGALPPNPLKLGGFFSFLLFAAG
jgi:hypothetical protein